MRKQIKVTKKNKTKVKDLYLGDVEGSEEFKNQERINQLYYLNISDSLINKLISGEKRYIHGYKGTGKTSLLKVLENKTQEKNIHYISLSYRTLREDAEFIHTFRKKFNTMRDELNKEEDKDTIALTFWRWYILSLISKQFIDSNPLDLIYGAGQGIFKSIATLLDMIVVTFSPDGQVSLGMNTDNHSSEEESIIIAARKIRLLTKEIKEKLDKKIIIFIDELELSRARSTYEIDKTLIKNLILATKSINQINNNLHIVLAIRDEVLYNLRGDEINKLRDDFGVSMNWWNTNDITIEHNLWKVMFKKIRYSMDISGEKHLHLSNTELWKRWFPFDFEGKEAWKVFFELTWARPRDFVRLLNLMKENAYEMNSFTLNSYDMAVRTYSERAYNEISEELATIFDDTKMDIIVRIIQKLGVNFTEDEFINMSKEFNLDEPDKVLGEMYRVSFIGNHYRINRKSIWRFFYRNNKHPERSKAFEVHTALHDALAIKGTFRRKVYDGTLGDDNQIEDRLDMWRL